MVILPAGRTHSLVKLSRTCMVQVVSIILETCAALLTSNFPSTALVADVDLQLVSGPF